MTSTERTGPIVAIERVDFRLSPFDWPFARTRTAEIDAHWQKRVAANPHLFNGEVLLMQTSALIEQKGARRLEGQCFSASFKSFIAWRDFGFPDATVANVFGMAALRSADGAYLLGEMGSHTAAAGRIYFPAGTPDAQDLKDGAIDLEANVLRELMEETGLGEADVSATPGWTLVPQAPYWACMKEMRSNLSAAEIVEKVGAFLSKDKQPELLRLKPVFSAQDFEPQRMPGFILAYLRHRLALG